MAFSPAALLDMLRRDKVKDPFGGDDLFDGESRFAGKGPKIALAASGLMFLLLIGGVTAIVLTGDDTAVAPPVVGTLADLQVEEEPAPSEAAAPPAAASVAAPVAADPTAATDRSAERRPWLAAAKPAPAAAPPRLGMVEAAKAPAPPAPVPAKPAAVAAIPAPVPAPPPAALAPPPAAKPAATATAATPAPAAPAETKTTAVMTPSPAKGPAAATPPTPLVAAPAPAAPAPTAAPAAEPEPEASTDIAGIPPLNAPGQAPGAPRRYDLPAGTDTGPAVAGGRPRLVEPPLPPTTKTAINAPPPRFANLTDVKSDAGGVAPPVTSSAKVAVIISGLGLSQSATDAAINKLPAAVTLAFSPYARDLKKWVEKAKAKGHEVLIEVPMESKQFPSDDPGPLGLLTSVEAKENQERLDTIIKESTGAVGVLDMMGSKFRESSQHINPVFVKLKQQNLFYVQGTPGGIRAGEATVPTAIADVLVDERPFRAAIDARLDYTERLAKYQGSAVAALGAKPVSFERLVLWIEQTQKKGVALAPISQVLIR
jgi:polysaccharide deacetylase 2 family uncharacterized protein YibQ